MAELLGIPYSPWTEKARFALDVRRVPYTFRRYQPLLGEPALRLKLRRATGNVTVPVLTDDNRRVHADSLAIARWADERGEGPSLFPAEHEAEIARWVDRSEAALAAGRALSLRRMLGDPAALAELVPKPLRALGPMATRVAALGVGRTLRKYGGDAASEEAHRRTLADFLEALRAGLAQAPSRENKMLFGRLTFADIAVAQAVVSVEPPSIGLKLGEASRRAFMDPELRVRFADLVAWRDTLYAKYRGGARPERLAAGPRAS